MEEKGLEGLSSRCSFDSSPCGLSWSCWVNFASLSFVLFPVLPIPSSISRLTLGSIFLLPLWDVRVFFSYFFLVA
jgi:hypothetical protein